MGLCRTSVEISSETDRRQALWEWGAGWGIRLEPDTKVGVQKDKEPKACRGALGGRWVGAGTGRWDTASNKCWVGANYLPIILTSFATCEADGPYEPNMPGPNVVFIGIFNNYQVYYVSLGIKCKKGNSHFKTLL
jgi:hypothetical protein